MAADMEASMFIMFNMHVCMHMHTCVHGTPSYTPIPDPTPIHPSATPQGDPRIGQNSITLELIKIFQFRLKIEICGEFPSHGWVHDLVGGWMGGMRSNH